MTPDTFRNCYRRAGLTTEPAQSVSPDQDGSIGELWEELANVPDAVPKGEFFEDFLSVHGDVAITVSASDADTVSSTIVMLLKSTEEAEDVASESRLTLNEVLSAVDVLRHYFFEIERHGLELVQTMSRI